jgi:hypothetical protein
LLSNCCLVASDRIGFAQLCHGPGLNVMHSDHSSRESARAL